MESVMADESYHYEKYETSNQQATEQCAAIYDPSNDNFYICAICKRYAYRMFGGSRIVCERPGCLDLEVKVSFIF